MNLKKTLTVSIAALTLAMGIQAIPAHAENQTTCEDTTKFVAPYKPFYSYFHKPVYNGLEFLKAFPWTSLTQEEQIQVIEQLEQNVNVTDSAIPGSFVTIKPNVVEKDATKEEVKTPESSIPVPPAAQEQKPTPAPAPKPTPAPAPAPKPEAKPEVKPDTTPTVSTSLSQFENRVIALTNEERTKAGLPAFKIDTKLSGVARIKSDDMSSKGYFSHTSPTYGSPFDMMSQFGISYSTGGENIAQGQTSPEEVVQAWMNSAGHKANIMNPAFTHIGVGHVSSGNYWTQLFIGK